MQDDLSRLPQSPAGKPQHSSPRGETAPSPTRASAHLAAGPATPAEQTPHCPAAADGGPGGRTRSPNKASMKQHLTARQLNNLRARASIDDPVAGVTCHFCRKTRLCGELGCPRCTALDPSQLCIGKSECNRCGGPSGRFCRACLLVRYGDPLSVVRARMARGAWLCPHCYEDDHPEEAWICNSAACMIERGLQPTGIAIFEAQEQGFRSVAHLVQYKLHCSHAETASVHNNAPGSEDDIDDINDMPF